MPKRRDQPIKPGVKPATAGQRQHDHELLRELLEKHGPPTFEGAARGKFQTEHGIVLAAGYEYAKLTDVPRNAAVTAAWSEYWRMWDER